MAGLQTPEGITSPPKHHRYDVVPAKETFRPSLYSFDPSSEPDYQYLNRPE